MVHENTCTCTVRLEGGLVVVENISSCTHYCKLKIFCAVPLRAKCVWFYFVIYLSILTPYIQVYSYTWRSKSMSSVNLREHPCSVDTFIVLFKSKDNKTFLHQK